MTFLTLNIIAWCALILGVLGTLLITPKSTKQLSQAETPLYNGPKLLTAPKSVKRLSAIILGIGIIGILFCVIIGVYAGLRGMYNTQTSIPDILYYAAHSPIEDKVPNDTTGTLFVFYRFDCPDCNAVYDELESKIYEFETTHPGIKIYQISSRSTQGKALKEQYPISSVPTLVYTYKDPDKHVISYAAETLAENRAWIQSGWDTIIDIWASDTNTSTLLRHDAH